MYVASVWCWIRFGFCCSRFGQIGNSMSGSMRIELVWKVLVDCEFVLLEIDLVFVNVCRFSLVYALKYWLFLLSLGYLCV